MIVDDQREISRLLQSALVTLEQDLEIVEIPSGEEAILDATSNKVDLLVADYRLPGISGLQLMKKIRSYQPSVKVILITGMLDPFVRKEVAQAGADAFFIKPISIADFLDSVERVLGLVETILPLEPILEGEVEEEHQGLADQFSDLRIKLNAQAVLLLNDCGWILACAGELPEKDQEASLVASLLAIYRAGQDVSQMVGNDRNSSWHLFRGGKIDLIYSPLNTTHAILVAGTGLADDDVVHQNLKHFAASRKAIEVSVMELEGPVIPYIKRKPVENEPDIDQEEVYQDLEPLFMGTKEKVRTDELNAFWDDAAEGQPAAPIHADNLSYEQARKLGLAPEDG